MMTTAMTSLTARTKAKAKAKAEAKAGWRRCRNTAVCLGLAIGLSTPLVEAADAQPAATPVAVPVAVAAPDPWVDGEQLVYDVEWSVFTAARATFTAQDLGPTWKFNLDLKTTGMVANMYTVDATIWSIQQKSPWRSLEFAERRDESKRTIRERTQLNYELGTGHYQKFRDGWSRSFAFQQQALDDVGSMLYSLRRGQWREGDVRPIAVHYADAIETSARLRCVDIKDRDMGAPWGKKSVIRLLAEVDKKEFEDQKVEIFVTNDAQRLPLKANVVFYYGSFLLKLVEVKSP